MNGPLYVLLHRAGPGWVPGAGFREQPGVGLHVGFMQELHAAGHLVLGGPYADQPGPDGLVGMAITDFATQQEAEEWAQRDPSLTAGLLRVEVRPWLALLAR